MRPHHRSIICLVISCLNYFRRFENWLDALYNSATVSLAIGNWWHIQYQSPWPIAKRAANPIIQKFVCSISWCLKTIKFITGVRQCLVEFHVETNIIPSSNTVEHSGPSGVFWCVPIHQYRLSVKYFYMHSSQGAYSWRGELPDSSLKLIFYSY